MSVFTTRYGKNPVLVTCTLFDQRAGLMARKRSSAVNVAMEDLKALSEQPKEVLAALLTEIAATHPDVSARLARHTIATDPVRLAATFRKRLQNWMRPGRFLWRSDSASFGAELEAWIDEIDRELLPLDPVQAHKLAETFLTSDGQFFEQADDSDGAVGDAIRAGCRLWLHTAKARPDKDETYWIERVHALTSGDEYGAREALLTQADLLFDEVGLRLLARRFESDLDKALLTRVAGRRDHGLYQAAAAIEMIADALHDPDLSTKTMLRLSPEPNQLQKEQIAERYIRFGRPEEALAWLDGDWEQHNDRRERLLAEAYSALGNNIGLRAVRQSLFERTGSPSDFKAWHRSLPATERDRAVESARQRAKMLDDPIMGAQLLLALDDDVAAEVLLLERRESVSGAAYHALLPLAKALDKKGRMLGTVVCYRALLIAILARAYAKAYGHAAEYLSLLRRLDAKVQDYGAMNTHSAFESSLRDTHGRKVSFWNRLRG